ncbi:unnamed protein product [Spirodela intermedia]|uniref:Uncharacterized protein n=1 Tax=Spirodela intermedia TaxID=51605 RepID=A0A7I8K884_SPIIN|nr:unnamed protein product [Spirodela intermedia]
MVKKGGTVSTSSECEGEMVLSAPSFKLSKTNYDICVINMEVYLDSHDLWQAIIEENVSEKKDWLALLAIFSTIPEEMMIMLDAKKTANEN